MNITHVTTSEYLHLETVYKQNKVAPHLVLVEDLYYEGVPNMTVRCLCGWSTRNFPASDRDDPVLIRLVRRHSKNYDHPVWTADGYFDVGRVGQYRKNR